MGSISGRKSRGAKVRTKRRPSRNCREGRSQRQARLAEPDPWTTGDSILWAQSGLEHLILHPSPPAAASCVIHVTTHPCARLCAGGKGRPPGFPHPASSWERMLCRFRLLAWDLPAGSGSIIRISTSGITAASNFRGQLVSSKPV